MPLSGPASAAFLIASLISSLVVARLATNFRSTTETFGVVTRIAEPSSLPLSSGRTRPTAFAAPVVRGDHRQRRGAGPVEVLVQRVEGRLVAGVGVDGRHEAVLDADGVVEHLGDRRQAVRRARGVRDDQMLLGQLVVIDAIDDREVGAVRRRGDDDALGARGQEDRRLVARGENAGAFDRDVDAEFLVRQLGRVLDRRALDLVSGDEDRVALDHRPRAGTARARCRSAADARWSPPDPGR